MTERLQFADLFNGELLWDKLYKFLGAQARAEVIPDNNFDDLSVVVKANGVVEGSLAIKCSCL